MFQRCGNVQFFHAYLGTEGIDMNTNNSPFYHQSISLFSRFRYIPFWIRLIVISIRMYVPVRSPPEVQHWESYECAVPFTSLTIDAMNKHGSGAAPIRLVHLSVSQNLNFALLPISHIYDLAILYLRNSSKARLEPGTSAAGQFRKWNWVTVRVS